MRYTKLFAGFALAAGMALTGASSLSAADWDGWRDRMHDRQDIRRDYDRVDRMRADIARDRARLDEDIRCGRTAAASRDAADLARDQRALQSQYRDIHEDHENYRQWWR